MRSEAFCLVVVHVLQDGGHGVDLGRGQERVQGQLVVEGHSRVFEGFPAVYLD